MWTSIISAVPALINTAVSVVKDKKVKNETKAIAGALKNGNAEPLIDSVIHKDIASGVSVSHKRAMNVVGTPALMYMAYQLLSAGNTIGGAIMALSAVIFAVGMAYITHVSEK